MTDFTPKIKYSDEASDVFRKHRDYQRQKEKNKNKNIENREELGYATIDWSRFNDKSAEKAESFFKSCRIKTFGSEKALEKVISNPDNVYQKEYYRDRKSKADGREPEFGERKWNIVDFYDTENNKLKVKESKEIQEKIKEENNKKNT